MKRRAKLVICGIMIGAGLASVLASSSIGNGTHPVLDIAAPPAHLIPFLTSWNDWSTVLLVIGCIVTTMAPMVLVLTGQGEEEGSTPAGGARRDDDPLADWFDSSHAPALAERIKSLLPGAEDRPAASGTSSSAS